MKTNFYSTAALSLLAAIAFIAAPSAQADIAYHITINTSSLIGDSAAPFALDFQLNGGNALANTVTLSNFTFGLGSANSNPAPTTFGLASGNLSSTVTISDSTVSFSNEFYQGFTPGSALNFDVALTTNVNGPTPDSFSVAILDSSLQNLDTDSPSDSLLTVDLNSATPSAQTFTSTGGVTVTAALVPEPTTAALIGTVLLGACGLVRRRRA